MHNVPVNGVVTARCFGAPVYIGQVGSCHRMRTTAVPLLVADRDQRHDLALERGLGSGPLGHVRTAHRSPGTPLQRNRRGYRGDRLRHACRLPEPVRATTPNRPGKGNR